MQDLSSPTRDWTQAPCRDSVDLNHLTASEVHSWLYSVIHEMDSIPS